MFGRRVVPIAIGILAGAAAFSLTHTYGLFGFDSYPILLTSRVQNVHDFLGNFTEELMDGRFEGHFYRPALNFSFALDAAIWKLNPLGYQLTNAILFGACVAVTFVLARSLLGRRAWIGPFVAALVFFFHPTHVEVVPVPSRRPEMLAWCFGAAALVWTLHGKHRWWPAVLCLIAMLSKETAFLLPAWIFVALYLTSGNLQRSMNGTVPHLGALLVAFVMRLAVLHGLGGYPNASIAHSASRLPAALVSALDLLLLPQPPLRAGVLGIPFLVLCLGAALVVALLLARRADGKRVRDAILIGVFWVLAVAVSTSLAGRVASWYLFLMVGGWALCLGALAEAGWTAFRARSAPALGGAAVLLFLVSIISPTRYSPFVFHYREWDEANQQSRLFLNELNARIGNAAPGSTIPSPPIPRWAKVDKNAVAVRGAALFSGATLDAYFELAYPERHIRLARRGSERPGPEEIVVVPTAFVPGFDGP